MHNIHAEYNVGYILHNKNFHFEKRFSIIIYYILLTKNRTENTATMYTMSDTTAASECWTSSAGYISSTNVFFFVWKFFANHLSFKMEQKCPECLYWIRSTKCDFFLLHRDYSILWIELFDANENESSVFLLIAIQIIPTRPKGWDILLLQIEMIKNKV